MRLTMQSAFRPALLLCVAVAGCWGGSNPNWSSTDQGKLVLLLSDFDEAAKNLANFKTMFAPDAQPTEADRLKFRNLSVTVAGTIQFEGNTATIPAKITDLHGTEVARTTWKAVKQDGIWRLTAAPVQ